jgi:hypothetical protein
MLINIVNFSSHYPKRRRASAAQPANAGEFAEAMKWQKKAIAAGFVGDKEEAAAAEQRLKLYEQAKPFREGQ